MAQALAEGLESLNSIKIAMPVQTNMVFAEMPVDTATRLRAAGAISMTGRRRKMAGC